MRYSHLQLYSQFHFFPKKKDWWRGLLNNPIATRSGTFFSFLIITWLVVGSCFCLACFCLVCDPKMFFVGQFGLYRCNRLAIYLSLLPLDLFVFIVFIAKPVFRTPYGILKRGSRFSCLEGTFLFKLPSSLCFDLVVLRVIMVFSGLRPFSCLLCVTSMIFL